ncbi:FkbM family methyltransferase [Massilia sp. SYSU DXS3249]
MLWRALKHVEHGVYVDVGAQHPVVDSVSKAFYEHGWRGVHVEPVQAYADLLRQDRPDDTVLQMALSDSEGILDLNVIPETGLSTAIDAYAERYQAEQGFTHTTVKVPMLTLKSALEFLEGKDVHWLKIDVEGLEEKVLRGWDPARLRPWIMVIEATVPTTTRVDYASWEPLVTGAGYRFVYFDGLNRFYVADEHPELMAAFSSPPNVFDSVRLSGLANSELCRGLIAHHQAELAQANADGERLAATERELADERELSGRLEAERASLRARLDALQDDTARLHAHIEWMQGQHDTALGETARLHAHIEWMQRQSDTVSREREHLSAEAGSLRAQVAALQASTSWRVTAPMRRAIDLARRIKGRLRRMAGRSAPVPMPQAATPVHAAQAAQHEEQALRELSPRANRILAEIHQVIHSKAD